MTTTNVFQGCGYVKFRVWLCIIKLQMEWLCAKRCGYVWSNCNHMISKYGVAGVATTIL